MTSAWGLWGYEAVGWHGGNVQDGATGYYCVRVGLLATRPVPTGLSYRGEAGSAGGLAAPSTPCSGNGGGGVVVVAQGGAECVLR
jgi:hypothetical protein